MFIDSHTIDLPIYDELFHKIENAKKSNKPVLLTGIRRSGKSTFLQKFSQMKNGLFLDSEGLFKESEGNISRKSLEKIIYSKLQQHSLGQENNTTPLWIIVDEIQFMRYYGHIGGKDLVNKFYSEMLYKRELAFIFSSSEKGLAENFLRIGSTDKNRANFEIIEIPTLSLEETTFFLKKLSNSELNLRNETLEEIFCLTKGIPGWIALVADIAKKTTSGDFEDLSNSFIKRASTLTLSQLKQISVSSERYTTLMILIANGKNNWSTLKKAMHMSGDFISDTRLGALLNTLNGSGFVGFKYTGKKKNYYIIDPIIELVLKKLLN